MQIGEFAKLCDTRISILRHYDKMGLLVPDYVDRFTGYRYYSRDQVAVFVRITALKKAGLSLQEIKDFLAGCSDDDRILALFGQKEQELKEKLVNLNEAKKLILGGERQMINVSFTDGAKAITAAGFGDGADQFHEVCGKMEKELAMRGYQRISSYRSCEGSGTNGSGAACEVVRLNGEEAVLREDIDLDFEDDSSIVGQWEVLGEYAVKEDFYGKTGIANPHLSTDLRQIYFLPGGEQYWCYGWTKGKLLIDEGENGNRSVNHFTTEICDGNRYMFIDLKSYYYRHGGQTTVLVLRQLDNKSYSAEDISRKDDIDIPFEDDNRVIGRWKAFDYCCTKEAFDPAAHTQKDFYFSGIEFLADGEVVSWYDFGRTKISGSDMQTWTKGYVLRKWNGCACAYELRDINGAEYLFIEWKSGDYRYGGFDTDYYVFVRA